MSERARLHRTDPERTEPIRDWSGSYRASDSVDSATPKLNPRTQGDAGQADVVDQVAHQGVELGYRIIDKHIREGQSAAEEHHRSVQNRSLGADRADPGQANADRIIERTLRAVSDLLPLWRELLNSIVAASLPRPSSRGPIGGGPIHTAAGENGAIAVELTSPRPTRVTIALQPGYDRRSLVVRDLHSADSTKPALTDIGFIPTSAAERACVKIRIPQEQPPGVYIGVVADTESQEACGTVTIRLS